MRMTETQTRRRAPRWRCGDRVTLWQNGIAQLAWISSVHRVRGGIEYVVHTEPGGGATGRTVNVWERRGNPPALTPVRGAR
jgi:hypothetical protein